jgi:hypothetical protein
MKKARLSLYCWLLLAFIYLLLNFLIPADKATLDRYHISGAELHFLDVTILIPVVLIWFLAYLSYINLNRYHKSIEKAKDGPAFKYITLGIRTFAYGLPSAGIVTTTLKWISKYHLSFIPSSTILTNYIGLIVPFTAFYLISVGVRKLTELGNLRFKATNSRLIIAFFAVLGSSYTFLTFHQNAHVLHAAASAPNLYYLPNWLILFTIVVPYIVMWSIGLLSVLQIGLYQRTIKGIIYKGGLAKLALGLGAVLLSYVVLEYLTSLTNKLLLLHIGWLLLIIYCFLVLLGVGYALIALGSRHLRKIEEV